MEKQSHYAIIGGSSGIGFALAKMLIQRGHTVTVGGRSRERLDRAQAALGMYARAVEVDIEDRVSLARFFAQTQTISGLFTPAASYTTGSFRDGNPETSEKVFEAKFWGQYWAVHTALPYLTADASVVLMAGAASARPLGAAAYAACNAALEGLARGLAVELNPIRVNCLSPGTTDSELWRKRPAASRQAAYSAWNQMTLNGRVATVDEQAHAALFLLENTNMTGTTLYCDGGYALQ